MNTDYCHGCDNDFYNAHNQLGVKECWYLKSAKVVERYRIGWWVAPDRVDCFSKVRTYSCHSEVGRFAFCEGLPKHLKDS